MLPTFCVRTKGTVVPIRPVCRMSAWLLVVTGGLTGIAFGDDAKAPTKPLVQAHAHNDYLHQRPLLDAVDRGFMSVEADIFLVQGELLVAHDVLGLRRERTLAKLYLDPLRELIRRRQGWMYEAGQSLTLLIDIKSEAQPTYAALHELLAQYADIMTTVKEGVVETKAVTAIISGNRPRDTITAQKVRYAGIDGRVADLDSDVPVDLVPLISDSWLSHFRWKGEGPMPAADRQKLAEIVRRAHARHRRVRFWAIPDQRAVWQELRAAGVDLINTDDLDGLQEFLTKEP
ncbi:MAG: phosphatidylinositol-specific phospholipase C/glycerophosphodiester phosphodiesterase family protein [Planctomycetes bacterium]|nr:phosphatidylinositol-specific phospholipase C/glycerophosphodiester phosphodiesterase family protein [Planctomycetota bacterium]